MNKEDFKCLLIQKYIEINGRFPSEEERAEIQKLADFAFSGDF